MILLGDSGVGKTAIIKRYYDDKFEVNSELTYNAHYLEKEVIIDEENVCLELWDTAGQEDFRSLTKIFVKNSKIIVLVYDVTSLITYENLNYWYEFIQKEIGPSTILGVIGNKTDLIFEENYDEEISPAKGKEFANKIGAEFAQASAKESAKEIISLFTTLISKYLDVKQYDPDYKNTIRLITLNENLNNKSGCCLGKSQKTIIIKMVFLGNTGVGKTSIIKGIEGNNNIKNLTHTQTANIKKIYYNKHGQNITVELKDTNWEEYTKDNLENDVRNYKVFFLVFDIHKKNTLYSLKKILKFLYKNKKAYYLLGYNKDSIENKISDFDFENEAQNFATKYSCDYEYVTIDDIYKVKAIILDYIKNYLVNYSL